MAYTPDQYVTSPLSAAYQYATGQGGIGLEAMDENIRNFLATQPTEEATRAAMAQYGVSEEDVRRATGKSLANYFPKQTAPAATFNDQYYGSAITGNIDPPVSKAQQQQNLNHWELQAIDDWNRQQAINAGFEPDQYRTMVSTYDDPYSGLPTVEVYMPGMGKSIGLNALTAGIVSNDPTTNLNAAMALVPQAQYALANNLDFLRDDKQIAAGVKAGTDTRLSAPVKTLSFRDEDLAARKSAVNAYNASLYDVAPPVSDFEQQRNTRFEEARAKYAQSNDPNYTSVATYTDPNTGLPTVEIYMPSKGKGITVNAQTAGIVSDDPTTNLNAAMALVPQAQYALANNLDFLTDDKKIIEGVKAGAGTTIGALPEVISYGDKFVNQPAVKATTGGSAAYQAAMAPGGIGVEGLNQNIQNFFASNPDEATTRAAMQQFGVSDEDIKRATGKSFAGYYPSQSALPVSNTYTVDRYNPNDPASSHWIADPNAGRWTFNDKTGERTLVPAGSTSGALSTVTAPASDVSITSRDGRQQDAIGAATVKPAEAATTGALSVSQDAATRTSTNNSNLTLIDFKGNQYKASDLTNLYGQIAGSLDPNSTGGVFKAGTGQSIGFDYNEIQKLFGEGKSPTVGDQVLLDIARGLLSEGITDLKQLEGAKLLGTYGRGLQQYQLADGRIINTNRGNYPLGETAAGTGKTTYSVDLSTGKPIISTTGVDTSDRGSIAFGLSMLTLGIGGPAALGSTITGGAATGLTATAIGSGALSFANGLIAGKDPIQAIKDSVKTAGTTFLAPTIASMVPAEFNNIANQIVTQLITTGKVNPISLATTAGIDIAAGQLATETGIDKATATKFINAGIQASKGNVMGALTSLSQAGGQSGLSGVTGNTGSGSIVSTTAQNLVDQTKSGGVIDDNNVVSGGLSSSANLTEDKQIALSQLNTKINSLLSDFTTFGSLTEPADLATSLRSLTDPYGKPLPESEITRLVGQGTTNRAVAEIMNRYGQIDPLSGYMGLDRNTAKQQMVAAGISGEQAESRLLDVERQVNTQLDNVELVRTAFSNFILGKGSDKDLQDAINTAGYGQTTANDLLTRGRAIIEGKSGTANGVITDAKELAALLPDIRADVAGKSTFNDAFATARKFLGAGATFTWQGKLYSTATAEENPALSGKPILTTNAFNNTIQDGDIASRLNMGLDAADVRSMINEWNSATDTKRLELLRNPAFAGIKAIYDEKASTKQLSPSEIASTIRSGASGSISATPESGWVLGARDLAGAIQDTVALVTGEPGNTAAILNRAGGQMLQAVGGVSSTLGATNLGRELTRAGQVIEGIGESTSAYAGTQQQIINNINAQSNWGDKLITAGKSAFNNLGAIGDWIATEGLQEGPALLAFGAVRVGKAAASLLTDGLETMGFAWNDARAAALASGKSITESNKLADKAAWLSAATTLAVARVLDDRTIKALQDFKAGRITQETAKEAIGGALDEGGTQAIVQAVATGKLDPNAIGTAAVLGGMIESKTSGALTTVGQGAYDNATAVNNISQQLTTGADANTALSGSINSALSSGASSTGAINSTLIGALNNNIDPAVAVSSTLTGALNNNLNTNTAVSTVISSAIANDISPATAISSAIDSTLNNGNVNTLTVAGTATSTAIGSSLLTTGNASSSIDGAITGTLNNNLATSIGANGSTTLAVNTSLSGALTLGVTPGTAINNVVGSTINNGGNPATAVASAVATALAGGINPDIAVTTALNAAAATGNNLSAGVDTNLSATTGNNLSVDTNTSGKVTTAIVTDSNNNTSTTVTNNGNTNTSTTTVINNNTGSSTTTTINNNTGTVVTETIDTNSGLTVTTQVDTNTGTKVTTAIDTNTGVVVDTNTSTLTNTNTNTNTNTSIITNPPQPPRPSTGALLVGGSGPGALPGPISPTMLEGAPIENAMNLQQLVQLYPQLANVDPRLLQMLSGRGGSSVSNDTGTGNLPTALSMAQSGSEPSPGMPTKAMRAPTTSQTTDLLGSTGPLSGKLDPLTAAGLTALEKGIGYAKGGLSQAHQTFKHNPEFITGATGYYVKGRGDGQSDDIPAMLADGEYVFDADTVAALGNGSSDAGAKILDKMRENIRKHKRSAHHSKIPPKAKSPLEYLKG